MNVSTRTLESTETTTDAGTATLNIPAQDPEKYEQTVAFAEEIIDATIDAGGRVPTALSITYDCGNTSLTVFAPSDARDDVTDALREAAEDSPNFEFREIAANEQSPADLEEHDDDHEDILDVLADAADGREAKALYNDRHGDIEERWNQIKDSKLKDDFAHLAGHPADAWDCCAIKLWVKREDYTDPMY